MYNIIFLFIQVLILKDTLEVLNLGGNHISSLPESILNLKRLRILFLGSNEFDSIPPFLGQMGSLFMLSFKSNRVTLVPEECLSPSIGWLILTDNKISHLPSSIGRLHGLRKLMLANNQLKTLPNELANCRELELIRLSRNELIELPTWLLQLPKLSWLAVAGNPGSASLSVSESFQAKFTDFEIGRVLGQGASGVVHEVLIRESCDLAHSASVAAAVAGTGLWEGVALKIFRSKCTSDGHPSDEVAVATAVGSSHCNLLPVFATVTESKSADSEGPDYALLLPRMPERCRLLGLPPSFNTVTRDVYNTEMPVDTIAKVLCVLRGVASASAFLHSRGIMHGDLYAHNIHVYPDGQPILVDFGAASTYDMSQPSPFSGEQTLFQRIEIRAFGCLIEELTIHREITSSGLRQVSFSEENSEKFVGKMRELVTLCKSEDLWSRPLFTEILERLENCP